MKLFPIFIIIIFLSLDSKSQNTYLPLNTDAYDMKNRMETLKGQFDSTSFTGNRVLSRQDWVNFLENKIFKTDEPILDQIDLKNGYQELNINEEWASDKLERTSSKQPILNHFYLQPSDFLRIKNQRFFLNINPVLSANFIKESGLKSTLSSSRGFEIRGRITNKIGFYSYFTDNQEVPVSFVKNWINQHTAVPGADYYKDDNPNHYDYMLAKGYIDFAAIKNLVQLTFGYDKQFFGEGIRSLILSDFSANATFFKINTHVGKLNYQNLFLELVPQYTRSIDYQYPHKYAAIHHLSMNLSPKIRLGLFESVIFSRKNHFEFSYIIPVIFYRAAQRQLGDPDNSNVGLDFKAIIGNNIQVYSQLMLDDFTAKEIFSNKGYWANKWAFQAGMKYYDAFHIHHLDLQAELNVVRPYTYAHYDSTANYSHYNQPLAHPLGSNFIEFIGKIQYQPFQKWILKLTAIHYQKGIDTNGTNYGGDIFKNYFTATSTTNNPDDWRYNHSLLSGVKVSGTSFDALITYQPKSNLFLDFSWTKRMLSTQLDAVAVESTNYFNFGLRLNISRRDYLFY